ncbi:MAG: endonuclease/exonuclease/phosphatase family protein [Cryobacterium sp.]|uniref:endonuclease/exonuclease/phosphatase family protein n=1 Tax=unclassified Cryobacterium TaxID=2649013 RepID=UPI0018CB1D36|nr:MULTISPECIES: endonuclease/exonuclease/phosphatase family protein [unclassified Cryobacterium]MCY7403189.1 endonuclease/exonuclease/phosphatase family protein [Cryobacterium sp.]MEC5152981.1 endonuclease/exonuclease/phosphatase (EEP) superfamily protein YafD [Cryobacterium sp. CAN_C3]
MFTRLIRALILIGAAGLLLVLTWPQAFGLHNTWVVAHLVSFRAIAVIGAVVGIVLLGLLMFIRPLRRTLGMAMVLLVLFGVANVGILATRGFTASTAQVSTAQVSTAQVGNEANTDSVTVLSWNTLGDAPGAAIIADLAVAQNVDVVTLPETTEEAGILIAKAMRDAGRPMWVHTLAFDLVSKARSTTLLISPDLGDYVVSNAAGSGPPGNTNVLPTVVAEPVDGRGPTIVAVHAVAPIQFEMSNWRSDLDWLATKCQGDNVIMAGDFNSTLDHMAGRAGGGSNGGSNGGAGAVLGNCADTALSAGAAAVGTWPTSIPAPLGSPIDHVMATPNWQVTALQVIETLDGAGSDHRPIVATLTPVA